MPTLDWLDKDKDVKLSKETKFHLLSEVPEYSYGNQDAGNIIINGDNLDALKALLPYYKGRVKCIYIDPPYNTGSAFENYDDNLEHSKWLRLMYPRLELLYDFLSYDGLIWVQIDDNEQAYLKVIMDEIFGRNNFIQMISVKRSSPAGFKVINPGPLTVTDYILLYAKNTHLMKYYPLRIPVPYDENYDLIIDNINDDPQTWRLLKLTDLLYKNYGFTTWRDAKKAWGNNWKIIRNSFLGDLALKYVNQVVSIRDPHKPSKKIIEVMEQSKLNRDKIFVIERDYNDPIYIINGGSLSFYKNKVKEIDGVLTPTEFLTDFWSDINFAGMAKEGGVQFKNSKKPEMLVKRVLEVSTNENDLVMDSFLGSGTTAAVAQKMNRHYIGIELGNHAVTHVVPRLKQVIDGEQSGISKVVQWHGGGGYKFYRLGGTLYDDNGLLNKNVNAKELGAFIFYKETQTSISGDSVLPFLGTIDGVSYYLLYSADNDTCLNLSSYKKLNVKEGKKVIYADICRMNSRKLREEQIEFKQIPYDLIKLGR